MSGTKFNSLLHELLTTDIDLMEVYTFQMLRLKAKQSNNYRKYLINLIENNIELLEYELDIMPFFMPISSSLNKYELDERKQEYITSKIKQLKTLGFNIKKQEKVLIIRKEQKETKVKAKSLQISPNIIGTKDIILELYDPMVSHDIIQCPKEIFLDVFYKGVVKLPDDSKIKWKKPNIYMHSFMRRLIDNQILQIKRGHWQLVSNLFINQKGKNFTYTSLAYPSGQTEKAFDDFLISRINSLKTK